MIHRFALREKLGGDDPSLNVHCLTALVMHLTSSCGLISQSCMFVVVIIVNVIINLQYPSVELFKSRLRFILPANMW